jgi:hypothetical protein
MLRKHSTASKQDPAGPARVIANKSVTNPRNTPIKPKKNITNDPDRLRRIAVAAYYRTAQRGFVGGYEVQDWLEAEAMIDGVSNQEILTNSFL